MSSDARRRSSGRGGLTAALAALALAVGAAPAAAQDGAAPEGEPFTLTTPGILARWAFIERATVARSRPERSAPAIARLSTRTPEGTAGLVLALQRVEVDGRLWVRVRLPVLPNNTTGWVRRDRLGAYNSVRTHLIVDTGRLRARLVRSGRTIFRAPVGVGQGRWPTPRGRFFIRNRLTGFSDPIYGPLAFGTSARSAVLTDWPAGGFIGIHGTNQPGILPGRVSHGCIRMRNKDILRLSRRMPVGTPLTIR